MKNHNIHSSREQEPEKLQQLTPAGAAGGNPHSARHRQKGIAIIIIMALVIGLLVAIGAQNNFWTNSQPTTSRPTVKDDGNTAKTQREVDIASIVSKVSPSVVSITTQSESQTYFGTAQREGAGTGIVVSSDGYVMTNKHVVDGVDAVRVVLSNGESFDDVKVIGNDPLNDVAFLKIPDVNDLTPAELGNSSSVSVGQSVIAIGNSLGQYQNTVTSGIISGKGRPVAAQAGRTVESLTDLLQTDAAINPGNSGGPLLNMAGQVIGMNTAIAAEAQGIGFAIPVNGIKGMLKGVLESGEVKRSYLGVNFVPVTPESADHYKLDVKSGAYIFNESGTAVMSGSPADRAGIKERDIITKVNDVEIGSNGALSTLIGEYAPGDTVTLTFLRDGNERSTNVTLDTYR